MPVQRRTRLGAGPPARAAADRGSEGCDVCRNATWLPLTAVIFKSVHNGDQRSVDLVGEGSGCVVEAAMNVDEGRWRDAVGGSRYGVRGPGTAAVCRDSAVHMNAAAGEYGT